MNFAKITACILAVCFFFSAAALSVGAEAPTYDVSEEYEKSQYYDNLINTKLIGNGNEDVVSVALSQLGYHEGDSEADFGGNNENGSGDYVEYNVLYGKVYDLEDDVLDYGYSWCASFVNWCLRQAGVNEELTGGKQFISCWKWREACILAEIYKEKENYTPKEGDLIFFIDINDKTLEVATSHIGIVLSSDGENVYTIEGNTSHDEAFSSSGDNVARKSYPLDSPYIVGYASPEYEQNPDRIGMRGFFTNLLEDSGARSLLFAASICLVCAVFVGTVGIIAKKKQKVKKQSDS